MDYRIAAGYEKGVLRPLEPLDLPEHTRLTVTVRLSTMPQEMRSDRVRSQFPTRPQPLSALEPLIGTLHVGGDAQLDSEALKGPDW